MKKPLMLSALFTGAGLFGLSLTGVGTSQGMAQTHGGISHESPKVLAKRAAEKPTDQAEAPTALAAKSTNALAVAMYHELLIELAEADKPHDNLFYSPTSISSALMLTYEGSRGQTQAGFEQALALDAETDRAEAHKSYAKMLGLMDGKDKPYELAVANALWGEKTMPFNQNFLKTLNANYSAGLKSVDFMNKAEKHRVEINDWVAKTTKDRIKDLLPKKSLDSATRLVLVNALYFKSPWYVQFKEHMTQALPFYLMPEKQGAESKSVKVPLMHLHAERFMHADMDGYDALKMYYKGRDLSMVVLLPDEKGGLPALEKKLDTKLIQSALSEMKAKQVNVWLPKWKITQAAKLKKPLKRMGMADAFDGEANFSGIPDSAVELFIDEVYHKAFIEVDEKGTEAAAATAVVLAEKSAAPRPEAVKDFRADHPFVYLIRDERSGAILFMGRVTDPS